MPSGSLRSAQSHGGDPCSRFMEGIRGIIRQVIVTTANVLNAAHVDWKISGTSEWMWIFREGAEEKTQCESRQRAEEKRQIPTRSFLFQIKIIVFGLFVLENDTRCLRVFRNVPSHVDVQMNVDPGPVAFSPSIKASTVPVNNLNLQMNLDPFKVFHYKTLQI